MATNKSFTKETGGLEIAKFHSSQIAGKTVLITGVSPGGIGEATARAFAHGGASTIIATGRSMARVEGLTKEIAAKYPSTKFYNIILDLASLKDVYRAANEILNNRSIEKIDVLINNAGTQFGNAERELTVDGIETHLAANYLGHFLFTKLLLPRLLTAAKINPPGATRIISLSSEVTQFTPFRFSDWNFDHKEVPADERPNWNAITSVVGIPEHTNFEAFVAYAQSKTATSLLAVHLNTLFAKKDGIFSFVVHPGGVMSTSGIRTIADAPENLKAMYAQILWKSIDQGSSTTLVAATDPELNPEKGVWLEDNQLGEPVEWAVDKKKAERLWKWSEEIVAEKLGI